MSQILLSADDWHPFPRLDERPAWEAVPETVRRAHIELGRQALGYEWPALPATLFLDYARTGTRVNYERVWRERRDTLRDLVLAECLEGQRRFLDDIANGIWTITEETYWGFPAHMGMQKAGSGLPDAAEPTVDLFAAETAALLAWTHYLLGSELDEVSPLIRDRIALEIDRRILTPNRERDDFWWMGFAGRRVNNWNPWINSNWLTAVLLIERDEERRIQAVHKILHSLDRFLNDYPADGGCDEGPGYWGRAGASLFDCLELLYSATEGAIDLYAVPLIQEIGRYINRAHIHNRYFINFADAGGQLNVSADLVFRYGERIGDEKMMGFGAFAAREQAYGTKPLSESIGRLLPALFNLSRLLSADGRQPLLRDVWLPELQVMAARRQEGSAEGFYLAAKGGHNAESHNHNDVGNFIVYAGGHPVIVDAGVGTYTAQTFSSQRYEIWTMQSAYHNLPTINGVMQQNGRSFAARDVTYTADEEKAEFSLELAGAYPASLGLQSWRRTVRLNRARGIELIERYALAESPTEITLTLMTPWEVDTSEPGRLKIQSPTEVKIDYPAEKLTPVVELIHLDDPRLESVWGPQLYRILLRAAGPPKEDTWTLSVAAAL